MLNRRRLFVTVVFIILLFFMMTFASGPVQNQTIATRLVTFIDGFNDKIVSSQTIEVGTDAIVPEDPVHRGYVFVGWYLESDRDVRVTDFTNILNDLTVIGLYAGDANNNGIPDDDDMYYTVTFRDTITDKDLSVQNVLVGMDATAPLAPTHNGYRFDGWSRGYTNVNEDIIVNTVYTQLAANPAGDNVNVYHTVTFVDGDTNKVISSQQILDGLSATAPKVPTHANRVFDYWDGNYTNVTTDVTVTAIYTDDLNGNGTKDYEEAHYTVKFVANQNGTLEGKTVYEDILTGLTFKDAGIVIPKTIAKENCRFSKWDKTIGNDTVVNGNVTYTAIFKKSLNDKDDVDKDENTEELNPSMEVVLPASPTYDGEDKKEELKPTIKDKDTGKVLVEGEDYEIEYPKDENTIDAGDKNLIIHGKGDYEGVINVVVTIKKATITVVTPSATKVYDGTALTSAGILTGLVKNETVTFVTTGSQTVAGTSNNTYSITWNGTAKKSNYKVNETIGKLTVTAKSFNDVKKDDDGNDVTDEDGNVEYVISISSLTDVKYDGAEHKKAPIVKDGDKVLVLDVDYTLSYEGSTTDAGTVKVTVTGINNYADSRIVTYNITKRNVTLTSGSATKVYDGTPLTKSGITVTGDGFATGEGATYSVNGSQTIAGWSDNNFTYILNSNTKPDNYNITKVNGKLTVTKKQLVITDEDDKEIINPTIDVETPEDPTYDGTDKKDDLKPTIKDKETDEVLVEGEDYVIVYPEDENTTDAGDKDIKIVGINDYEGEIEVVVTIKKASITVVTPSDSKEYDGTALTKTGSLTGLVNGETVTFVTTGTQTDVGTSDNTYSITWDGTAKQSNYKVTDTIGKLTVTAKSFNEVKKDEDGKEVTDEDGNPEYVISISSLQDVKYDGAEHKFAPEVKDGDKVLVYGTDYTLSYEGSTTNAGTVKVTVTGNKNYTGSRVVTYNITKRDVTLTSGSDSKVYDGTALTKDGITVSGDGFAIGEGAVYTVTGTITQKGESNNTFTYTLNNNTLAINYNITKVEGKLSITSKSFEETKKDEDGNEITDEDGNPEYVISISNILDVKYDGTEHKKAPVVKDGDKVLALNTDYTVSYEGSTTDAGTVKVTVTGNKNYTGSRVVTYNITKRDVTLTSGTSNKVYDGTALINENVTVSGDGFANGEGASYSVNGSQTIAGWSNNNFTYTLNNNTKADNYNITKVEGKLTVTAISSDTIVIVAASDTKVYDGTALTNSGYTYTQDVLLNGDVLTAVVEGTITDVGSVQNKVVSYKVMHGETDVTSSYSFGPSTVGTLSVTKRPVTITSASDSKEYDGTALTNNSVSVTSGSFASGEGFTYSVTGSQTAAGTSDNAFTYVLNENTKASNYNITKVEGKLTITAKSFEDTKKDEDGNEITDEDGNPEYVISISSLQDVKYDGAEHKKAPVVKDGDKVLVNGTDYTLSYEGSTTDAGTVKVTVTGIKNYTGSRVVTYNITKRDVTLTSGSSSRPYNGVSLTNGTVTVSGDGFANGEGATYSVNGSQTVAGTSNNNFTYTLNSNTKADNYNITKVEGKLTITAIEVQSITITANSDSKKYDGTALTNSGYTYTQNVLLTGDELSVVVEGTITDAGSVANRVKEYKVMNGLNDVTNCYTFSTVNGTLTVTKRNVTLTSATDTKEYTGVALTNHNVSVTGDGFVQGESVEYEFTGSQLEVGHSTNTFTYTFAGNTKAQNYNINKVEGTLTVTKKIITPENVEEVLGIKFNDGSFEYDNKAHSLAVSGTIPENVNVTYTNNGKVNVANYNVVAKITCPQSTSYDCGNGVELTAKLSITKREVTLTADDKTKVYGHENPKFTASFNDELAASQLTYTFTTSVDKTTAVGVYKNAIVVSVVNSTALNNYKVNIVNGTLTVNPVKIETPADLEEIGIKLEDKTYTYNKTSRSLTITGTLPAGVYVSYENNSHTDHGVYNVTAKITCSDESVFDCGTGIVLSAKLTINKADITITPNDSSKKYGNQDPTSFTSTVTGLITGDVLPSYVVVRESGETKGTYTMKVSECPTHKNYNVKCNTGTFTITRANIVNWVVDGTNVETDNDVIDGTQPRYDGVTPTKASTVQYNYTFSGWKSSVDGQVYTKVTSMPEVTSDVTYTAQFDRALNKYTVKFYAYKNNSSTFELVSTQEVEYGKAASEPKVSESVTVTENGNTKTYYWMGWDKSFNNITGDLEVKAVYSSVTVKDTTVYVLPDSYSIPTNFPYSVATSYDKVGTVKIRFANYDHISSMMNQIAGMSQSQCEALKENGKRICGYDSSGYKEYVVASGWDEVKTFLSPSTIETLNGYNKNGYTINWYVLKYTWKDKTWHLDGKRIYEISGSISSSGFSKKLSLTSTKDITSVTAYYGSSNSATVNYKCEGKTCTIDNISTSSSGKSLSYFVVELSDGTRYKATYSSGSLGTFSKM